MSDLVHTAQRLAYYARGLLHQTVPYAAARWRKDTILSRSDHHPNHTEIDERIGYYNKLYDHFDASSGTRIADIDRQKSRYYLDLDEYSRAFGPNRRLHYLFGDVTTVPDVPTIVKSRPICAGNENSVVLKLDKLRHFRWGADPIPFEDKQATAVWRGTPHTEQRRQFIKMFYNHRSFDIGHSRHVFDDLPPKRSLTHQEQKEHKFFVSIEGNDVATNLKWAMASNMLVMSPRLRYETWFMEGALQPNVHFVLLNDDLSDLEEKVDYYTQHADEAEEIIRNAHAWVNRFTDPLKESIISLRVLEKYFKLSEQI